MPTFRISIIIIIILCLFTGVPAKAQATAGLPNTLVILIPGMTLDDITNCPGLSSLAQNGALGLMNTSGSGSKNLTASYLSMAAGIRSAYPYKEEILGLQISENINGISARELYRLYSGEYGDKAEIVFPYYYRLFKANPNTASFGKLAAILAKNGIPLYFAGNHDLPGITARPGVLLAMDEKGRIKEGVADSRTLKTSTYSPTYYTTDYSYLWQKTQEFYSKQKGIVILDLGDLARLERIEETLSPQVLKTVRDRMLQDLDNFVSLVLTLTDQDKDAVFVIVPYPAKEAVRLGNTLSPVIYRTKGIKTGLLTSAATKRHGILTNSDIVPSLLNIYGLYQHRNHFGYPVQGVSHPEALSFLKNQEDIIVSNYIHRPYLLKSYVISLIIVVLFLLTLILFKNSLWQRFILLLLTLTSGPLFFLLLPLVPGIGLAEKAFLFVAFLAVFCLILRDKSRTVLYLTVLFLTTFSLIVLDLLLGTPLMRTSLLSYDPISGARYYGIGNEYLGVLLGSCITGLALLLETADRLNSKYSAFLKPVCSLILILVTCLVAAPQWGTNVGGGITFLFTSLLFILLLFDVRLDWKTMFFALFLIASGIVSLFYYDLQRPVSEQSHIGATAHLLMKDGIQALAPIVSRKLSMNIKLMQYSLWTRVFLSFLGGTAILFFRPPVLLREIFTCYPYLKKGLFTGLAGTFMVLASNDSGIVAAATSMLYIFSAFLQLVSEKSQLHRTTP